MGSHSRPCNATSHPHKLSVWAGIPSEGYATVYEPIFKALERDTRLLQLYVLNNNSAALKNSVNGADTIQVCLGHLLPWYIVSCQR